MPRTSVASGWIVSEFSLHALRRWPDAQFLLPFHVLADQVQRDVSRALDHDLDVVLVERDL